MRMKIEDHNLLDNTLLHHTGRILKTSVSPLPILIPGWRAFTHESNMAQIEDICYSGHMSDPKLWKP
jgi:hypothetical protein